MSNPPKEGTSEWDQWCSQDGALQKALCIIWSQTHVPNSPTPTTPSPTPKPKPNPAAASAPSITAAPPPPPDKPSNDDANNIRPTSANPSPSKTQNPAYTEGISSSSVTSSTITSATIASNTVSANLSTNQTSSDPTTTTTIDSGNFDNQTASNPAAKAMKFWIPLIGVIVLVLIVFTIASCLGYQFVRRRKLKKQLQRATLGSLEKGEELLNHCESTGEVSSPADDVSSTRSSSDNVVSDESPLSVDNNNNNNNNIFSGKITVDALTSTMYYNGQVVPPIGTRIIPPEDQIKLDVNETQPEEIRYNSRSLTFPET